MSAPPPKYYWLKVRSLPKAGSAPLYDGHYLRLHGSGFASIMVMPGPPKFLRTLMFPQPAGATQVVLELIREPERTWGLHLERSGEEGKVAGWEAVRMVAGQGDEGFVWKGEGEQAVLTWKEGEEEEKGEKEGEGSGVWQGWMVCEWAHGHPQLFWVTDQLKVELPSWAERVEIVREMLEAQE